MPLELSIDVIPHGYEQQRQRIGNIRITQVEKLDADPDGERIYRVVGARDTRVRHRRGDGALALVAKAFASDCGPEGGSEP